MELDALDAQGAGDLAVLLLHLLAVAVVPGEESSAQRRSTVHQS